MWAKAFDQLMQQPNSLAGAILRRSLFPLGTAPHEQVSAVMAARLAVAARQRRQRLVLMTPPPAENLPRVVAAGLLMSHLVHQLAPERVPPEEAGPLLEGDLLLVTHAVGVAIEELRQLRLGKILLHEVWPVESYSRYTPVMDERPRVFVANIGWVLDSLPGQRLSALVIDATHPRTLSRFC